MARKKNTETPVTEDTQAQDPTVTSKAPVIPNKQTDILKMKIKSK